MWPLDCPLWSLDCLSNQMKLPASTIAATTSRWFSFDATVHAPWFVCCRAACSERLRIYAYTVNKGDMTFVRISVRGKSMHNHWSAIIWIIWPPDATRNRVRTPTSSMGPVLDHTHCDLILASCWHPARLAILSFHLHWMSLSLPSSPFLDEMLAIKETDSWTTAVCTRLNFMDDTGTT